MGRVGPLADISTHHRSGRRSHVEFGDQLRAYSVRLAAVAGEVGVQALLESDPDNFTVSQGATPRSTEANDQLSDLPEG
jgi:hypothetical protein